MTCKQLICLISLSLLASCSNSIGPMATTEAGFFSSADIELSYALDLPTNREPPYAVIVFGHGSGPDTKDRFADAARRLTQHGIAVLRFDKRGVGQSSGEYRRGYADFNLLSGDLLAAVDFISADQRIHGARIGIMGSSQAGWIMPMVAARTDKLAFAVLRSSPTVTVAEHNFWDTAADDLSLSIDELLQQLDDYQPPESGDFDPIPYLRKMSIPSIWLLGGQDRIIPAPRSAQIVRDIAAQMGHPFTVVMYPDADHGLRPPGSRQRVDYWQDLLPWLDQQLSAPGK
jgi:uncharacterized protein